MPCDTGYYCTSTSGKYKIGIQHCRYDNSLGNVFQLEIGGRDVKGAKLGPAFDGEQFGGFEISLPTQSDSERVLSVEWVKKTGKGFIRDESRVDNPGPFKIDASEPLTCQDEG
jgi:hypothetical protein